MKTLLIVLLAIHLAVCPLGYAMLGIVLIVGLAAGEVTAWVLLPYGCGVSISVLIIKWSDEIGNH